MKPLFLFTGTSCLSPVGAGIANRTNCLVGCRRRHAAGKVREAVIPWRLLVTYCVTLDPLVGAGPVRGIPRSSGQSTQAMSRG